MKFAAVQYRKPDGAWVDVPAGSPSITQGQGLLLKEIPFPANAAWPAGKPANTRDATARGTEPSQYEQFASAGSLTMTASCGNSIPVHISVVRIDNLQYKLPGQTASQDVTVPLSVPGGSQVQFKAIP